jgi:hypothetical protein
MRHRPPARLGPAPKKSHRDSRFSEALAVGRPRNSAAGGSSSKKGQTLGPSASSSRSSREFREYRHRTSSLPTPSRRESPCPDRAPGPPSPDATRGFDEGISAYLPRAPRKLGVWRGIFWRRRGQGRDLLLKPRPV